MNPRSHSHPLFYTLNILALAGVCGILLFAFAWQLLYDEVPCPLCLLQRAGFALVGIGLLLNIRFGPSPLHYGVAILSAMAGAGVAFRQFALHLAPGDAGYGSPFLGMHFYTWALLTFIALIAFCAVMLMLDRACRDQPSPRSHIGRFARFVMWLFFVLVLANMGSTLLECGFGQCEDDPVGYLWITK
ncbi:disulfide bond formation protein B [Alcaligenaceae bacterium CGII-47]|nr:disulfide bond formation protein B [Alcaligenaceae bacterium CGII-47]